MREQLDQFSGIVSPRFSKPQAKFITQMIYGRQAHQDVKLSSIARALGEDIRVLSYERLRNLVTLVLAAVYFSAVWLGESLKLAVLTTRITQAVRRFFGVPDFHYYALADEIAVLFSRLGRYKRRAVTRRRSIDDA